MRRSGEAIGSVRSWLAGTLGDARAARLAARTWRRGGVALIILCLLVYIPGLWTIPPVDRDESRFAQASRQMLESGTLRGWVVPMVQDRPRLNKPPLIYWLQATSAAILGDAPAQWSWLDNGSENIWVYRVPSVLAAITTVLLTWRLGMRLFDPRAAWLAAALLAVCPMVVWDAHQARADQVLLATTTATMFALWVIWSRAHHGDTEARRRDQNGQEANSNSPSVSPCLRGESSLGCALLFWVFLALGIMTKGPITPMIAGLTCVSLSLIARRWRWLLALRPLLGLLIVAALVGPWICLVGQEVGWSEYWSIVYSETIGRSAGAKEGHWGPPGYHLVLLGLLFWPGSLLTAAAIGRAWRRGLRNPAASTNRDRKGAGEAPDQLSAPESAGAHPTPSRSRLARIWHALRDARPSRPAELFLLAWMLPSWLVFELISTKLPHYTMPLYPAVALITARMLLNYASRRPHFRANQQNRDKLLAFLATEHPQCPLCRYDLHGVEDDRCPECGTAVALGHDWRKTPLWGRKGEMRRVVVAGQSTGQRMGEGIWWVVGAFATLFIPSALAAIESLELNPIARSPWATFVPRFTPGVACVAVISGVVSILFLSRSLRHLRELRPLAATWRAIPPLVVAYVALFAVLLPSSHYLWISNSLAEKIRARDPGGLIPLADVCYFEDSLVFLTRGRVRRISDPDAIATFIRTNPQSLVITDTPDMLEAVLSTMREYDGFEVRSPYSEWVNGYNYSKGEPVSPRICEIRHD